MEITLQLTLSIHYFKIYGVAAWESEKLAIGDSTLKKKRPNSAIPTTELF